MEKLANDLYKALVVNYKTTVFGLLAVSCSYVLSHADAFGGQGSALVDLASNVAAVSGVVFSIVSKDTDKQ